MAPPEDFAVNKIKNEKSDPKNFREVERRQKISWREENRVGNSVLFRSVRYVLFHSKK